MTDAADVVDLLREAGASVATAESLTGGLVVATLVTVPGASDVVRGGVVAYAVDVKTSALGVDPALLDEVGTVDDRVAVAMAVGVRARLDATWGLATTGVAGPGPAEGKPAGTVHVAIAGPAGAEAWALSLPGDRDDVRRGTVAALLALLVARLREQPPDLAG